MIPNKRYYQDCQGNVNDGHSTPPRLPGCYTKDEASHE